jgi:fructose/tagatose bisphosphate aldolase
MIHQNEQQLEDSLKTAGVNVSGDSLQVSDPAVVRERLIDELIWTAVFTADDATKTRARDLIHQLARKQGAVPASIQPLYDAMGRGEVTGFTVPAFNIRALTYDACRAVFRAAIANNVGAFIFEIARSEIGYTEQRPGEYAACVLAAAVKEGYRGAVFIQGDHFQASAKKWGTAERDQERGAIEGLIEEAIAAEFYNIDIDTSTLVDLSFPTVDEQQRANYENCVHFTRFIRDREPEGIEISIGGEIGEVGHHNTTPEEFRAYMEGYKRTLGGGIKGISKVSIQTGTSHGGVPMADGTIAKAKIDFPLLQETTRIARTEYGIAGAVQHGASTLPEEVFDQFPKHDTAEIHLATGFQNMVLDHAKFPEEMRAEMRQWCFDNCAGERKKEQTDEQFVYTARKKTLGPFKQRMWELGDDAKGAIIADLEKKFAFLFGKLAVPQTKDVVERFVKVDANAPRPKRAQVATGGAMAFVNEGEGE